MQGNVLSMAHALPASLPSCWNHTPITLMRHSDCLLLATTAGSRFFCLGASSGTILLCPVLEQSRNCHDGNRMATWIWKREEITHSARMQRWLSEWDYLWDGASLFYHKPKLCFNQFSTIAPQSVWVWMTSFTNLKHRDKSRRSTCDYHSCYYDSAGTEKLLKRRKRRALGWSAEQH